MPARPSHKAKLRLDELLVKTGRLDSVREAAGWIMAGKVVVNGRVCDKPGQLVASDAEISVRGSAEKYVSRGGYKLEGALARFDVAVAGQVALDAGASTGGFTDCLLQHGARRVFSVDVGYGQLRGKLAADSRVVNLERTNISDLTRDQLDPPIDLCVADLSYLSLTKAIPVLRALFSQPVEIVCLVKPLFEGIPQDAFLDPGELAAAVGRVRDFVVEHGLICRGVILSPILGGRDSIEFLAHLSDHGSAAPDTAIGEAVAEIPARFGALTAAR